MPQPRPQVQKAYAQLRSRLLRGDWEVGTRISSQRELARHIGVTLRTVQQAIEQLEEEGLVHRIAGTGTFVARDHTAGARLWKWFERIVETAEEGIWIVDTEGRTTFVNEKMATMLGTTIIGLQGQPFVSLIAASDRPEATSALERQRHGASERLELAFERADGATIRVLVSLSPLGDSSGTYDGSLAMVTDITERSMIHQELLASDERYRTLVEELPVAAYTGPPGTDTPMTYVSPEIESILGYTRARWMSDANLYNSILHPDDYDHSTAVYQMHLETGLRYESEHRMIAADGRIVWIRDQAVIIRHEDTGTVSEHGVIFDITERKEAEEALRHQALHDGLTDLPNRTLLLERLEHGIVVASRNKTSIALVLIDLDRFKDINDTFGHHYGDLLLQEVATRMRANLRASDTLARLGGDEFAAILPDTDETGANLVVAKLFTVLEQPVSILESSFHVDASIGIALAPAHGREADVLLRHADAAMYQAKRAGGGSVFYQPVASEASRQRLELLGELRYAIENAQLLLHYQPKIRCASGALSSLEALVRWTHPTQGLLLPGSFVPLAEQTGLVTPLTTWVLEAALQDLLTWRNAGLEVQVSVNVPVRSLLDAHFVTDVESLLAKWNVPASSLALEITESSIMTDPERTRIILERLSAQGVGISIDDFGTGYSSLSYLQQIPVDRLKIDRRFVTDMMRNNRDHVIVQATINLAHDLELTTVAEGVEDEETLQALRRMDCDLVQGFHVARPMVAAAVQPWAAWHAR